MSEPISHEEALRRVAEALKTLRFGEITVKVEQGKTIWVDVHERYRVG